MGSIFGWDPTEESSSRNPVQNHHRRYHLTTRTQQHHAHHTLRTNPDQSSKNFSTVVVSVHLHLFTTTTRDHTADIEGGRMEGVGRMRAGKFARGSLSVSKKDSRKKKRTLHFPKRNQFHHHHEPIPRNMEQTT